jgi:hypothetical protein
MKKLIALVAICVSLTACVSAPPTPTLAPIATPADLTRVCPDIPYIDADASLGVAMTYITNFQVQYNTCAMRNDSLREVTSPQQPQSSSQGK